MLRLVSNQASIERMNWLRTFFARHPKALLLTVDSCRQSVPVEVAKPALRIPPRQRQGHTFRGMYDSRRTMESRVLFGVTCTESIQHGKARACPFAEEPTDRGGWLFVGKDPRERRG